MRCPLPVVRLPGGPFGRCCAPGTALVTRWPGLRARAHSPRAGLRPRSVCAWWPAGLRCTSTQERRCEARRASSPAMLSRLRGGAGWSSRRVFVAPRGRSSQLRAVGCGCRLRLPSCRVLGRSGWGGTAGLGRGAVVGRGEPLPLAVPLRAARARACWRQVRRRRPRGGGVAGFRGGLVGRGAAPGAGRRLAAGPAGHGWRHRRTAARRRGDRPPPAARHADEGVGPLVASYRRARRGPGAARPPRRGDHRSRRRHAPGEGWPRRAADHRPEAADAPGVARSTPGRQPPHHHRCGPPSRHRRGPLRRRSGRRPAADPVIRHRCDPRHRDASGPSAACCPRSWLSDPGFARGRCARCPVPGCSPS